MPHDLALINPQAEAPSPLVNPAAKTLPKIIQRAGPKAQQSFIEFFLANIRNKNTREAYFRAVNRFLDWCEDRQLELGQIQPFMVGLYIEEYSQKHEAAAPTVKQALAAIRMLFDWLVLDQNLSQNPAASVRGPKHSVKRGKTPVLDSTDTRKLLDSIDQEHIVDLRDRALIAVMVYSLARVSAVVEMKVEDYFQNGKRWWLRLHEKGGKLHEVPAHHNIENYLDAYLEKAQIRNEQKAPLFRSVRGRRGQLNDHGMTRDAVLKMIKRRAQAVGLSPKVCCHTFRATGITVYLENGGNIESAQAIANHESIRTTKLYDRRNDQITQDEIERILI